MLIFHCAGLAVIFLIYKVANNVTIGGEETGIVSTIVRNDGSSEFGRHIFSIFSIHKMLSIFKLV